MLDSFCRQEADLALKVPRLSGSRTIPLISRVRRGRQGDADEIVINQAAMAAQIEREIISYACTLSDCAAARTESIASSVIVSKSSVTNAAPE